MSRKATKSDVEDATRQLNRYMSRTLAIEFENRKCRIIEPSDKHAYSVPFGHTWYTYHGLFKAIWFAIDALRIAGVKAKVSE